MQKTASEINAALPAMKRIVYGSTIISEKHLPAYNEKIVSEVYQKFLPDRLLTTVGLGEVSSSWTQSCLQVVMANLR